MTAPDPYYADEWVTIYHGDCRDILAHITADVMVTDPPYGIGHQSDYLAMSSARWKGARSVVGDEDTTLRDAVLSIWANRPALVFGTWKIRPPTNTRAVLVWDKGDNGGGDTAIPWKPSHEQIYVLGHGYSGHRGPGVLRYVMHSHVSAGRLHPHQKPVDLMRDLIAKCPPGVVVDPFMGSGTTLRAAKDLGRRAIGIEVNERYCGITVNRLRQEVLAL